MTNLRYSTVLLVKYSQLTNSYINSSYLRPLRPRPQSHLHHHCVRAREKLILVAVAMTAGDKAVHEGCLYYDEGMGDEDQSLRRDSISASRSQQS